MRLHSLWIGEYKNLKDITVEFSQTHWCTAITGENGVGKTNLLEAIAIIFRDLYRNAPALFPYKIAYSINDTILTIDASTPATPTFTTPTGDVTSTEITANVPDAIIGYEASGSTRLATVFADADVRSHYRTVTDAHVQSTVQTLSTRQHTDSSLILQNVFGFVGFGQEASVGERQLAELVALLNEARDSNTLLLWDLPDAFLHPAWARLLLPTLQQIAGQDIRACLVLTTHNPLTVGSLRAEQVVVLQRDGMGNIVADPADADPKGLGADGVLTSDIFGLKSALDPDTEAMLHRRNVLAGQPQRTPEEERELENLSSDLARLGFSRTNADAIYQQFLQGLNRKGLFEQGITRGLTDDEPSVIDDILDEMLGA